ncbi:hypothetical protein [Streptomyces sp. NPDC058268]|uniref:hypothetical protein n=1 Tax=Streptomyces sp. NPDC058268 TaxID=3346413 RepID=UPI0036EFFAA2
MSNHVLQRVQPFTVFGLVTDHANYLMIARVLPGRLDADGEELEDDEHAHTRFAMAFLASSGQEAARLARRFVEHGSDHDEGMREDLRLVLHDWFEQRRWELPRSVSFSVTDEYDHDHAYDVRRATLNYADRTVEVESSFMSTLVEDVLTAISEGTPPENNRALTITLIPDEPTTGPADREAS